MPCTSDFGERSCIEYRDNPEMKKELDNITRMLCSLCKKSSTLDIRKIIGLDKWWEKHQEHDRKKELEKERIRIKRVNKAKALNKLTFKERKLLGL